MSTPKTSSLWSVGVMCTADSGSLGLSVTISSLLLWCFWHICFYTLRIQPKQYPDSRFALCFQWNTTGSTSGFLKGLCFGKQLLLLKLRPICPEWRMATIARNSVSFCRSSQTSSRACPFQLSPLLSDPGQTLLSITSYFARFNCVGWNVMLWISAAH